MVLLYFLLGIIAILILYYQYLVKISGKRIWINYARWESRFKSIYNCKLDNPFQTTLSGITHNNCQFVIIRNFKKGKLNKGSNLILYPDIFNLHDDTAIRVLTQKGWFLGWIPNQDWKDQIYHDLRKGKKWEATIEDVLKPTKEYPFHNILLNLYEYTETKI